MISVAHGDMSGEGNTACVTEIQNKKINDEIVSC